ncbi:hypothetical protein QA612_06990 [Evansella sp. AB-P1]|uniref:hypothetical protein n=1 Tax=Evansella sp. AB-P1 TaxID=3037653 RepID=UPI00241C1DD6|nr:hypothetical protein [Evansella sp. AB-P1]MDG5787234.1 hypothetical protein [Evansella sp. AB-P1]
MYLTETNVLETTKILYKYKLNAYLNALSALMFVQILALFFSFLGVGSMGFGSSTVNLQVTTYSGSMVIVFSLMWAFIISITMTTKPYRNSDFSFVTNRVTSHLSSIAFLITACIFAGVTSMLMGLLLKVIMYFRFGGEIIGSHVGVTDLFIGISGTVFYLILLSSLGYFVGVLSQLHKMMKFILPIVFFGLLFVWGPNAKLPSEIVSFFIHESSLFLFILKVVGTSLLFYMVSILISNRLEVRQ